MDYDDNDFQSHSFPLASEDNIKFSPSLRSYPLPKFELDDNLPVHLRFDNLVESEGLLGIQSQEESQWIKDFSGGSNGIEFGSSAAESCSISRRNNVWSEATSSESVEMLLKSVGQDEMIMPQNIIEEPPDKLTNQMEPNLNQDGSFPLPDECLVSLSGLSKDLTNERLQVKATPQIYEGEKSGNISSRDLEPSNVSGQFSLVVTADNRFNDKNCDEAEQIENSPLCNRSESMQVDTSVLSAKRFAIDDGDQNNQHVPLRAEGIAEVNVAEVEVHDVPSKETQMDDQISNTNVGNPSSLAPKANVVVHTTEVSSDDVFSENSVSIRKQDSVVLSRDTEMGDQLVGNTQEVLIENDSRQLDSGFDDSADTLTVEEKTFFKGQCDRGSNNQAGDSSSLDVDMRLSTNLIQGSQTIENVKDDNDGLCAHNIDSGADVLISSSMEICDRSLIGTEPSDVHISNTDLCVIEKENTRLTSDAGNVIIDTNDSPIIDKRTSFSSLVPSIAATHESQSYEIAGEETEFIEHKDDGVSPLSVEDSTHLVKNEETVTRISTEPSSLVVKESSEMVHESDPYSESNQGEGCANARDMPSENVSQSSSSVGTVGMVCLNEPQETLADKAPEQCSKGLEECPVIHDYSLKENEAAEVCEKSERLSVNVADASLNGCEASSRPATVSAEDPELHVLEAISSSPNSSEPICGSPTTIRSCDVSQSEKEHQDGDKGSLDQNAAVSDDIDREANKVRSTAHDPKVNDAREDDSSFTFEVSSTSDPSERETDNGWKPFPGVQPCESPQMVGSSPTTTSSTCQIGPKMLQEISHGLPLTSGGKNVHQNFFSKGSAEEKTSLASGKVADERTAKEGRPLKGDLPQSEKEHKKRGRGLIGQKTPVSDSMDGKDDKLRSTSHNPKENDAAAEVNKSFSFAISSPVDLTERGTDDRWKLFPCIQSNEFPQTVGVSPTASGLCQIDAKALQEISRGSNKKSGGKNVRRSSKGNVEDKTTPLFGKVANKGTSKDGKALKERTPAKQTRGRVSNSVSASASSLGSTSRVVQTEEMRAFGYVEGSSTKPLAIPIVQTSNLPDLNTSVSPSAFFHQPFTDFQQVQLRSQILVYGSLIQGTAPDEACMISAFGESDGGRSRWEKIWRAASDRIRNQKSPAINPETPQHLNPGARSSVQQSEALPTPGRAGSKGPLSSITNPVVPLSSPLWTISTPSRDGLQSSSIARGAFMDPHQTLFSLHPYQSSHMRHFAGHATPWMSQAPSGTWVVSPQTAAVPVSETVRVTSVRESSVPHPSGMQHMPSPLIHNGSPMGVPSGTSLPVEVKMTALSSTKDASAVSKPRKRKKSLASEEPCQIPTSVATAQVTSSSFVLPIPPMSSTHNRIIVRDTEPMVISSEETCGRIEQAKQQAEDAAALAASAVKHSQGVWSQLALQKNSGLVSDVEAKLTSSAVAIAAAASVAKAAAAAAKVAFDAALQAKTMADEALVASKSANPTPETSFHDSAKNLGKVTLASILKGKDKANNSDSIIVAAREAARKRVEAASAAAKRAENLDAIVKAAEMAAEAVSQAGTIVAMGEPIPLTLGELAEAGSEGYWKVLDKSSNMNREQMNIDDVEVLDRSVEHLNDRPSNKKQAIRTTDHGKPFPPKEISSKAVETHMSLVSGMPRDSVTSSEKGAGKQKDCGVSDLAKTIGVVPESQIGSTNASITVQNVVFEGNQPIGTSKENCIKEGSLVEVLSDDEGLRGVWFSAKVLSLKDGKAYICYTDLIRDEGSGQHKEWVLLGGVGGKAPRIRIAHPTSVIRYERAKKRSRATRGDYAWFVGDKVDAWIRDGWWEGIITEKSIEDETNLTVHFPAQRDTSVVRAWNLRPSRIWEDGQWLEWSRSSGNNCFVDEGDSPQEKPLKKSRHGPAIDLAVEACGKDKMSVHMGMEESEKNDASGPLTLSANEKFFTVGKNIKDEKKSDTLRTKRTGLQKEGSRVIFGVPKPGKKKKFMEVSKHYNGDNGSKISEGNDSVKFAKYLIPQESAPRGWKNTSKAVSKGKQVADCKPKELKSGLTKSILTRRTIPENNGSSNSVVSASNRGSVQDNFLNAKTSVSHDENVSEKQNLQEMGYVSNVRKITEGHPASFAAEFGSKGNTAPSGEKLGRHVEKETGNDDNSGRSMLDAVEPRRSNRRIQPTSRLLEGLQSSLIISKVPAGSHDKTIRAQQRSGPSRGSNRG